MPLVLAGATSGQATVQATDAQTVTITLPATSGTLVTTGGAQTIEFADGSASAPSITNSGDTNTGMFFPAADTIAFTEGGVESMRIDSSGNVGIGTTATTTYKATIANAGGNQLRLYATDVAASTTNTIDFWYLDGGGSPYNNTSIRSLSTANAGNGNLAFYTTPTGDSLAERMRITSGGFVGIGAASPQRKLTVVGVDGSTGLTEGNSRTSLFLDNAGANYLSIYTDTSSNGGIFFSDNGVNNGGIVYQTSGDALTFIANTSERMRIDSSGNLLVGKTSYSGLTNGFQFGPADNGANIGLLSITGNSTNAGATAYQLYSTSNSTFRFYINYAGTIFAQSTTITGISDQRLKENIVDLPDGLDSIMALKPRKFDWKAGKGKDIKADRGFVAQEFETVFPDMVDEWKDPAPEGEEPYKSVRADLIPVLVKAIQEQQAIITDLKARIETLENT